MRKIKIGQIGVLHDHAEGKLECVRSFPEQFELIGVVAESEALKQSVQNRPTYQNVPWMTEEELFSHSELEAVLVEGYELDLLHIAQRCIDRNLHIHLDKPAGDDIVAFEKLLRDAKKRHLVVQLAYMYRYNTAIQDCLARLRSGETGAITGIDAAMSTFHSPEKRKWLEAFRGGSMFFLGCHIIDLVYLFAGMPKRVHSFLQQTGFDGNTSEDNCLAVFEYDKACAVIRIGSTERNGYGRREFTLIAKEETIEIKPLERPTELRLSTEEIIGGFDYENKYITVPTEPMAGRYDTMMLDFARFVQGEAENPFSYTYEYNLQKLILHTCGFEIDLKEETKFEDI